MAPLPLFDEPQGHWDNVPGVRDRRRRHRWLALNRHPARATAAWHADFCRRTSFQCVRDRTWFDHGVLYDHAGVYRRLRQLDGTAHDRSAGYGLSAHEQPLVLAAAVVAGSPRDLHVRRRYSRFEWRWHRLDGLSAAIDE